MKYVNSQEAIVHTIENTVRSVIEDLNLLFGLEDINKEVLINIIGILEDSARSLESLAHSLERFVK